MLLKEPKGRDVGEDDMFTINEAFKSKSIRVKLSAVSSQKEGDAEHIETRQKVRGPGICSSRARFPAGVGNVDWYAMLRQLNQSPCNCGWPPVCTRPCCTQ